jgi:hypothetical protein
MPISFNPRAFVIQPMPAPQTNGPSGNPQAEDARETVETGLEEMVVSYQSAPDDDWFAYAEPSTPADTDLGVGSLSSGSATAGGDDRRPPPQPPAPHPDGERGESSREGETQGVIARLKRFFGL